MNINEKIQWMSQFTNGKELPNGYETSLFLPGKKSPVVVSILAQDESRYLVATPSFGKPFSNVEAWWIAKESAVKNIPTAQIFVFKPQIVQAERDEKYLQKGSDNAE